MHRAQYHEIQTPIPPQPASLLNIQAPPSVNSPHASTPSTDWSSVATPPSVMLEVYPQLPAHAASVTHCIPLSTASPAIEYPSPSASPYVDMHAAKEPHSFQSNLASYVQYHGHAAMFPTHGSDTPPSTPSVPEAGGAEIGMGFLNPLDNSIPVSPSQNFAEPSGQDQVVSTRLPEYTATGASGYGASNMLVWTEIFRENLLLDGQSRVSSPFQASANMMYQHELASDSFAHNSHQPGTAYTPQCNHIPQSDLEPLPPTPRGSSQQHAQPRVVAGNAFWPAFTMTPPTSTLPYPF
ncbi:hypothetical protein BOTBODRAFT_597359 [Botryobasidium botryosum FD-172 SS1]|uniref:Uncharacterized protein n=1 Tax=Botryobasidium botryosum (strain FD-172 SS1) TaxID=930990 RepID=A0A067LYX3_BOTB1|nr:hypothetical protein BOTBODRAFT_597359 [Botryobasidium botryosum FD-172 SS1]